MNKSQEKSNIMDRIDIVTVVNDFSKYNQYFTEYDNVNKNHLICYDNTSDNISITKRFNDYIDSKMKDNTWIVFCHQDFYFQENINSILKNIDKNCIYGPVGAGTKKQFAFFIRFDGIKLAKARFGFINKQVIVGTVTEDSGNNKKVAGKKAKEFEQVNTLDCCCFIIHSDLIKKMNYRFDENLDWHLYAEDLCMLAKKQFNIQSRILNIKSTHFSSGNFNKNFHQSLEYLKDKYTPTPIVSTCFDGVYEKYLNGL